MSASTLPSDVEHRPAKSSRRARVSRFARILLGATMAVHVPVGLAVADVADRLGHLRHPKLVGLLWAAGGVTLFLLLVRTASPDRRRSAFAVGLFEIPYFIHWCAAVFAFIPSIVATLLAPLVEFVRSEPFRLPMWAYAWSYGAGLLVCGYGVLVRRRWFRVVERELHVPGLDACFDGFRVAHLSDLHIGMLTPRSWGLAWARAANRRGPDLAVVTGDLITSGPAFHGDVADVIGELRAESGVYVSMGNHDYFGDGELLVATLRSRGARVLRNEGEVVQRGAARLWVAAIDDTWTRRDDIERALRDRPAGCPVLLLAHDPSSFDDASDAGATVVLSGHTHGGQIAAPFLSQFVNLAFVYRYRIGFYRRGRSVLYVHPGLGTTGPPMRLGVAPEVTILVLRSNSAGAALG